MKRKIEVKKIIPQNLSTNSLQKGKLHCQVFKTASLEEKIEAIKNYIKSDGRSRDPLPGLFLEEESAFSKEENLPLVEIFEL